MQNTMGTPGAPHLQYDPDVQSQNASSTPQVSGIVHRDATSNASDLSVQLARYKAGNMYVPICFM